MTILLLSNTNNSSLAPLGSSSDSLVGRLWASPETDEF
jgi:hypothetical protein